MRMRRQRRQGGNTVEFAVTSSVAFFLILAVIVGGAGVFRYQEVAHLAREGARYASTHGGQYQLDGNVATTGVAAVASSTDVKNYLTPRTTLLDSTKLTITASWSAPGSVSPSNIPTYLDTDPALVPPGQKSIRNYVTVTVSYQWVPEMYLVGPITLTSTSTTAMYY